MIWTDTNQADWQRQVKSVHGPGADTVIAFESGGSRSTKRIYAWLDGGQVGEFIVLKDGSDEASTLGKGSVNPREAA